VLGEHKKKRRTKTKKDIWTKKRGRTEKITEEKPEKPIKCLTVQSAVVKEKGQEKKIKRKISEGKNLGEEEGTSANAKNTKDKKYQ